MPKGSCLCGGLTYSFPASALDTSRNAICHCPQCRKLTSSLFLSCILVPLSDFTITSPVPEPILFFPTSPSSSTQKYYPAQGPSKSAAPATSQYVRGPSTLRHHTFHQPDFNARFTTSFCGECGTTICKTSDELPEMKGLVNVFGGTLDADEGTEEEREKMFAKLTKPTWELLDGKYRVGWLEGLRVGSEGAGARL